MNVFALLIKPDIKPKDFKELKLNLKVLVDNVNSTLSQPVGGLNNFTVS